MIPAEYRSLRPSTLLDATCSGDMYWGVPTVVPVLVAVEPGPPRLAADEFQDDVVRALDLLHVEDLDQVRVASACHDLGFLEEALERDRVGGGGRHELLDRDLTAEPGLLREIDGAHAATPQLAFDHVLADVPLRHARGRRHPRLR